MGALPRDLCGSFGGVTILLSLMTAGLIGASDFFGAVASRSRDAIQVTATMQIVAFLVMVPLAVIIGADEVKAGNLAMGGVSGITTGLGYACFFAGLGRGRISVVAPITAGTTALVPVLIGLAGGNHPSGAVFIGVSLVLLAIPLVAYATEEQERPAEGERWSVGAQVGIAALAGALFSVFYVVTGEMPEGVGIWPTVINALVGALVTCSLAASRGRLPDRGSFGRYAVASGFTLAVGAACLTPALQRGPVVVVTVISNLYPVVAVALGVAILGERLRYWHLIGVALAIAGVALISSG